MVLNTAKVNQITHCLHTVVFQKNGAPMHELTNFRHQYL